MKTDSFFYRFFLAFPKAFFTLIGENVRTAKGYKFTSVEVKDIAFRFDGIFAPKARSGFIYCAEAQFQKKRNFYPHFFTKIFNYLHKHKPPNDWRAIIIYPNRTVDSGVHHHYREFFESGRLKRIYLADLPDEIFERFPLNLLKIIIDSKKKVLSTTEKIIRQLSEQVPDEKTQEVIIELLINLLVSKLPKMPRKEIEKMFQPMLSDVKRSRFYQEIAEEIENEKREDEKRQIAKALLRKRMSLPFIAEVTGLSQAKIRALKKELTAQKNGGHRA